MKKNALLLVLLLTCSSIFAQKVPKVLIVGWDGVRQDAITQLRASGDIPVLDSLMNIGMWSTNVWVINKSISAPEWSTIMNGVYEDKHLVVDNSYTNANFAQYPFFPTRAKECNPNLVCEQIITWNPMGVAGVNPGGYVTNAGFDESIDVGDYGLGLV
ncbi:MAG: alkaline phosphatase family protein, partial [Bacteroidota bacterium]